MSGLARDLSASRYKNEDLAVLASVAAPLTSTLGNVSLAEDKATMSLVNLPVVTVDANGLITTLVRQGLPQCRVDFLTQTTNSWISADYTNGGDLFIAVDLSGKTITLAPGTYRFTILFLGRFAVTSPFFINFDATPTIYVRTANQVNHDPGYTYSEEVIVTIASSTVVTIGSYPLNTGDPSYVIMVKL